jgi:hypothetical protein
MITDFEQINLINNDLNNWKTSQRHVNLNDLVYLKSQGRFGVLMYMTELGTYEEILQRPTGLLGAFATPRRPITHLIDINGKDLGDISLPNLRNNLYVIVRTTPFGYKSMTVYHYIRNRRRGPVKALVMVKRVKLKVVKW